MKLAAQARLARGDNLGRKGKPHSEATKQKMREKRKLQVFSDESRKKMAESAIKRGKRQRELAKELTVEGTDLYTL